MKRRICPCEKDCDKEGERIAEDPWGEGSDEEANPGGSHRRSTAGRESTLRAVEASSSQQLPGAMSGMRTPLPRSQRQQ
eukprot:5961425-Prorocentrum_lima.AAC.1